MSNEVIRQENIEKALDTALSCFMKYGITGTTQNILSKESGFSLRSINRFFTDKNDLILRVTEKLAKDISADCTRACATVRNKNKSGIELLELYGMGLKKAFLKNPLQFGFKREVDVYLYRNSKERGDIYERLAQATCPRPVLRRILEIGAADGSMIPISNIDAEVNYLSCTYFNFLADIAVKKIYVRKPDDTPHLIDDMIQKSLKLYQTPTYQKAAELTVGLRSQPTVRA